MSSDGTTVDRQDSAVELKRLRRMFHGNPELGFEEFWTTARICEYLAQVDCRLLYGESLYRDYPEPQRLAAWNEATVQAARRRYPEDAWIEKLAGRTGAVAVITGQRPGPAIGFRFDIDGLPIAESEDPAHRPAAEGFRATNGNMHACGHDGHIAIGLGLAKRLADRAADLNGTFYLLFQPAEEIISGGKLFSLLPMIAELEYFFPVHVGLIDDRKVVCAVSFLADRRYNVVFRGRGAHAGAAPEQGRNALLAACSAAMNLYGISRHSGGTSRVNIGRFVSDNASNVIPDRVRFELDLRGETDAVCGFLKSRAEQIIAGAASMHRIASEMQFVTAADTAENSPELIAEVRKACLEAGVEGEDVIDTYLVPGSEDATFIMNAVSDNGGQAAYLGFGSPTYGGHHNEGFDFEEDVLVQGVQILFGLARNLTR